MDLDRFLAGLFMVIGKTSAKRQGEISEYVTGELEFLTGNRPLAAAFVTGRIATTEVEYPNGVSIGVDASGNATEINLPAGWVVEEA